MSDLPERIWAWGSHDFRGAGQWREGHYGYGTEYVRADLLAAKDAEIARLRGEVKKRDSVIAKVYGRITNIADDLDDQGDRAFLGSTNDADMLRSLRDEWTESRVMKADIATPEEEVANLRARFSREVAAAEAATLERAAGALWPAILAAEGTGEVAREAALSFAVDAIRALPRDGSALDAVVAARTAGLRHAALELDSFMRGDGAYDRSGYGPKLRAAIAKLDGGKP